MFSTPCIQMYLLGMGTFRIQKLRPHLYIVATLLALTSVDHSIITLCSLYIIINAFMAIRRMRKLSKKDHISFFFFFNNRGYSNYQHKEKRNDRQSPNSEWKVTVQPVLLSERFIKRCRHFSLEQICVIESYCCLFMCNLLSTHVLLRDNASLLLHFPAFLSSWEKWVTCKPNRGNIRKQISLFR